MTKFRCVVCGKLTAGRLPRAGRHNVGDTTAMFPRRHNGDDGLPCPGNIELAEWVDVKLIELSEWRRRQGLD